MARTLRIGVLALQGAFREHIALLRSIQGVVPIEVRTSEELFSVSGLIIPGGESTTIALIAQRWGLLESLIEFRQRGTPIWGTCAGLILLAEHAEGTKMGGQSLIGGLKVTVSRNFFGAQVESFETTMSPPSCLLPFGSQSFRAVFIRAPAVLEIGLGVEALCELELDSEQKTEAGRSSVVVAVRSENCLATAFHPELTGDTRWHQLFTSMVEAYNASVGPSSVPQLSFKSSLKCTVPTDLPVYGKTHISGFQ